MAKKLNCSMIAASVFAEGQPGQPENEFSIAERSSGEMLNTERVTDVKLLCGAVEIYAKKAVLSARVPFFTAALLYDTGRKNTIVIPLEISPDTVELIIQFANEEQPEITQHNAQNLLEAAAFFLIEDLCRVCDRFIANRIELTVETCLEVQDYVTVRPATNLLQKTAKGFIADNFSDVIDTDAFRRMSGKEMTSFLSMDQLDGCPSEEMFWEALVKWIQADVGNRKAWMPQLLVLVELPSLSKDYIIQKVLPHPYIDSEPVCRQILQDLLWFKENPRNTEVKRKHAATFSFQRQQIPSRIYVLYRGYNCIQIQLLQSPDVEWVKMPECSGLYLQAAAVGNTIYCVSIKKDFISLNCSTETWTVIEGDKDRPKSFFYLCSLDHQLVACNFGHSIGRIRLYCYNPSSNCWLNKQLNIGCSNEPFRILAVCGVRDRESSHDMLCVLIGPMVMIDNLPSVRLYLFDLQRSTFRCSTDLYECTNFNSVVVSYKQKVFVSCFKMEKGLHVGTVAVYDVVLDEWKTLPHMNEPPRYDFGLVVANNCLYAIGGQMRGAFVCSTVERLNLTDVNARWMRCSDLLSIHRASRFMHAMVSRY